MLNLKKNPEKYTAQSSGECVASGESKREERNGGENSAWLANLT